MRAGLVVLLLLAACVKPVETVDAGVDAGVSGPCLERPTELDTPGAALPCDLLPPKN